MATSGEASIIVRVIDQASKALGEIQKSIKLNEEGLKKIGQTATVAGAAITGAMYLAVESAAEAQTQMAKFNVTMNNSKGATEDVKNELLKAADATLQLGFDNEAAAVSLSKFFQATGDVQQAIDLNNLSMDLARTKNIDLETAAKAVGLTYHGNARALKEFGIEIDETKTPLEALSELQVKVAGGAVAFTDTYKGQQEILKQSMGELSEVIGGVLLPALTSVVEAVTPVILRIKEWTDKHPKLTESIVMIVGTIGLLLAVLGPLSLAVIAVNTALLAVGATLAVGGVLAVALTGIVSLIVVVTQHWEGLKWMAGNAVDYMIEKMNAFIAIVEKAIAALARMAARFNVVQQVKDASALIGGAGARVSYAVPRASGGRVNEDMTLVGERGPELVSLPRGSFVHTNAQTRGMMAPQINVRIGSVNNEADEDRMVSKIARMIQLQNLASI